MAEKDKKEKKEKRESNITSDMSFERPDASKIACSTCEFREKDRKAGGQTINGATLMVCACYPRFDKPLNVIFYGAECEYYVDEATK